MTSSLFNLFLTLCLSAASLFSLTTQAQSYPNRAIKLIVPFAAGGPADNYARFMAGKLQEVLGQSLVVDNRVGGGAIIGTDAAAKSAPDGYTLLVMSNAHTVNESLIPSKPYALMKDFVAIAPINASDLVLVVHPKVSAAGLPELLQQAKAAPGKMNYASSGPGTPYHMAGELLKSMAGVDIVHVPYKGSSGARTDVLGGQVEMMFDAVTTMTEQIKSGRVRAIATSGKVRSAVLPEVPTANEAGVPGYESTIWLGIMAPKGTPASVVEQLNKAIAKVVSQPEVQAAWRKQGAEPMLMGVEAFTRYIEADIVKWERVVRTANIKAN
jgi:tripartite-type tricarboxylate transporter receptor subunit TctC